MTTHITQGRYTLLVDHEGNIGIVVVDDTGAHWHVQPDSFYMICEVLKVFEDLTGQHISLEQAKNMVQEAKKVAA